MASNYNEISAKHKEQYGTDVGRYGGPLLVERYDDRTHFIYELLQNSEDALKRRGANWTGSRAVSFELTEGKLVVSHSGHPFTEADVRSVCSIALSTKGAEAIGKFGIGFKSVYTFTTRPEIHSGDEDFAIKDFVHPTALPRQEREDDETKIVLPLNVNENTATSEILRGLKALGPNALLFLRHIEELCWDITGSGYGLYLRNKPEPLGEGVGRVTVIGKTSDGDEVDQNWLVFERDVGKGRVEIAFSLISDKQSKGKWLIQPLASSPLVVFFPTVFQTNLGFLVQGPFLTTPSRDNVTRGNEWNLKLVNEAAALLIDALTWLRDQGMLDISTLRCLPIEKDKFPDDGMFGPLFKATKAAFHDIPLLPTDSGRYVEAGKAKLARTNELRDLISAAQLSAIFGVRECHWLAGDITANRTPEVRNYAMSELDIEEITPEKLTAKLSKQFLEDQPDEWVVKLYEFLGGQPAAVRQSLGTTPYVRLADGTHVLATGDVFLPNNSETGFLTVRASVCATEASLDFLKHIGISYPDPVDDVIKNILPKYDQDEFEIEEADYAADIERILSAYATDSASKRARLVEALKKTYFVFSVDAGDGVSYRSKPSDCYIATDRLKKLFAGVQGIYLVDNDYECLRGEWVRNLLTVCGAVRHVRPAHLLNKLGYEARKLLRSTATQSRSSGMNDKDEDWALPDLKSVLEKLPTLPQEEQAERARLIWESIEDVEVHGGKNYFDGLYTWTMHGAHRVQFPANFVTLLNEAAWVPDKHGDLCPPKLVTFAELGWKDSPYLLSKIKFKPPIIDQLAKEVGIDPEALDFIRKHGISLAELKDKLGLSYDATSEDAPKGAAADPAVTDTTEEGVDIYGDASDLYGDDMPEAPPATPDPDAEEDTGSLHPGTAGARSGGGASRSDSQDGSSSKGSSSGQSSGQRGSGDGSGSGGHGKLPPGNAGGRTFVSYVGVHGEEEGDSDGLDHAERMRIEAEAIKHILVAEPALHATEAGNPGFDLYQCDAANRPVRWIEVKSMTGSLLDRPATMSHVQFDHARQKGEAYWLYVVEYASNPERRVIRRIQNPAGKARSFTFDQGWLAVSTP